MALPSESPLAGEGRAGGPGLPSRKAASQPPGPRVTLAAGQAPSKRNPERTRDLILDAALAEFAAKGLSGGRVDEIAARAGVNKRMIYHYFGSKQGLFLAALERIYETIRREEAALQLGDLGPVEGMRRLVAFTWDYLERHPEFISMLNSENLHHGQHIRRSQRVPELHSPLLDMIGDLLRRGVAEGVFRAGVDPVQLYISMAGLGYFYLSNSHTLSTFFGRDLRTAANMHLRRQHMVEFVVGYLRPDPGN